MNMSVFLSHSSAHLLARAAQPVSGRVLLVFRPFCSLRTRKPAGEHPHGARRSSVAREHPCRHRATPRASIHTRPPDPGTSHAHTRCGTSSFRAVWHASAAASVGGVDGSGGGDSPAMACRPLAVLHAHRRGRVDLGAIQLLICRPKQRGSARTRGNGRTYKLVQHTGGHVRCARSLGGRAYGIPARRCSHVGTAADCPRRASASTPLTRRKHALRARPMPARATRRQPTRPTRQSRWLARCGRVRRWPPARTCLPSSRRHCRCRRASAQTRRTPRRPSRRPTHQPARWKTAAVVDAVAGDAHAAHRRAPSYLSPVATRSDSMRRAQPAWATKSAAYAPRRSCGASSLQRKGRRHAQLSFPGILRASGP